ncbi:hypothetical protein V6N11_022318 [Hibiscus sabdariffa]|uniref:Uncharacterized protein n=1 Tax=Hibiscus sabdariffa TaxID=183260 RepID=A0ABR2TIW0_9ROSI
MPTKVLGDTQKSGSKGAALVFAQSLPVPLTPDTIHSALPSTPATEGQGGASQADNVGYATNIHSSASQEFSHDQYVAQDESEPSQVVPSTSAPAAIM